MGRPKGSKNKPKVPVVAATPEAAPVVQKKRGSAVPAAPAPAPAPEQKKRGGRPKGSKNKPKTDTPAPAPTPAPAAPPTPAPEPPKGKKAAKTIVPTITPEALTKPASPSATQPIEVVRTPTESDAEPVETLTASQLNHPALAGLLATATTLLANASPSRKLMFENKANTDYTAELATLRTLVEFFEIDVAELIAQHAKKA
jgi:hypothetical protein